jgi:hypothetical protein
MIIAAMTITQGIQSGFTLFTSECGGVCTRSRIAMKTPFTHRLSALVGHPSVG